MTYLQRALTALAAGALALPLLASPASAAPGDTAIPPVQDIAEFCTNPTFDQFSDVRATDRFALAVRCIASARTADGERDGAGITEGGPEGIPDDQYGPERLVQRGQMASFIARMIDAADARDRAEEVQELPEYDGSNQFTDVPNNNVHVATINRLAQADVVNGGVGGEPQTLYSPNDIVSRAQMASFINRAAAFVAGEDPNESGESTGFVAPEGADYFDDDEDVQIHEPEINGNTSVGITQGDTRGDYNPRQGVTRAQMAGFISRTLSEFYDVERVYSVLELFSTDLDQAEVDRLSADSAMATGTAASTRTFTAEGLDPDTEYRITLVVEDNATRTAEGLVEFVEDAETGLAATGMPTTDITSVNGEDPQNNMGAGQARTDNEEGRSPSAVAEPDADGELTFTIEGEEAESVVVVLYINGGAGRDNGAGGDSPRLELDDEGKPVEFFGVSGVTNFDGGNDGGNGGGNGGGGADDQGPVSVDARVAIDVADSDSATGTASEGDFFVIEFDEELATDGDIATESVDGATLTLESESGQEFVVECGAESSFLPIAVNTAAECTVESDDRSVLTIELLEDPKPTGLGDNTFEFPLTITETEGLTDEEDNDVDLTEGDVEIERDEGTQDA